MLELEPLKKRLEKATPMPWKAVGFKKPTQDRINIRTGKPFDDKIVFFIAGNPNVKENTSENIGQIGKEEDAALIALMGNSVTPMILEIEVLRKNLKDTETRLIEVQLDNDNLKKYLEGVKSENKPV